MAKRRSYKKVARGKLYKQPQNEINAAMARIQSDGKLWRKVKKVRKSGTGTGTETKIKFYDSIDRARAKTGENHKKAEWLGLITKNPNKYFGNKKRKKQVRRRA